MEIRVWFLSIVWQWLLELEINFVARLIPQGLRDFPSQAPVDREMRGHLVRIVDIHGPLMVTEITFSQRDGTVKLVEVTHQKVRTRITAGKRVRVGGEVSNRRKTAARKLIP